MSNKYPVEYEGDETHESGTLKVSGGDGVALDGCQGARVGESGLRADDGVGDVVQGRVLLLLDFLDGTVLMEKHVSSAKLRNHACTHSEGELVDISFIRHALDNLGRLQGRRPFGEATELDQGLFRKKA